MMGLVAILGSGESGRGAAILAKKVGYSVFQDSRETITTSGHPTLSNRT